jgi:hypothetical protein
LVILLPLLLELGFGAVDGHSQIAPEVAKFDALWIIMASVRRRIPEMEKRNRSPKLRKLFATAGAKSFHRSPSASDTRASPREERVSIIVFQQHHASYRSKSRSLA